MTNASGSAKTALIVGVMLAVAVGIVLVWRGRYVFAIFYGILIAAPCLIFGFPWLVSNVIAPDRTPNPVAVQNCEAMTLVVRATSNFLKQSNGAWPRSWTALKDANPDIDLMAYAECVDFDFEAKPRELAKTKWYEFTGITPHDPAYNMYSSELQVLIDQLNGIDSTAAQYERYPMLGKTAPVKSNRRSN